MDISFLDHFFGPEAFTIILFGYFTLLAIGFLMMAGRGNQFDTSGVSGEPRRRSRRSQILTTVYLIFMLVTGVFAIFGSLMSWLPDAVHIVIGAIFALLFLVFPYWIALGDLFHKH